MIAILIKLIYECITIELILYICAAIDTADREILITMKDIKINKGKRQCEGIRPTLVADMSNQTLVSYFYEI